MTFPAYPGYRDSGVEWLGAVPSYWESWKISHAFGELGSGTTPPTSEAEWYEDGTVPWVTTGELREGVIWETKKLLSSTVLSAFSALRLHPAGSLAIAMYGATIGRLGILGVDATTNQACCLLTRPKHLHVKFTFYWLLVFKQSIIDLYASGGGQPNINQEIIANLKVPAPGIPEQTQIARFLDHETARIDALIEEQQRLIELLKEKRQAVISQAVTKGLNPTMPMKDSGVEWLGEVPAHWEVKQLKHVVDPNTSITYGIVQAGPEFEGGIPYIRTSDMSGEELPVSGYPLTSPDIDESYARSRVRPGDIVMSIRASVGKCLPVPDELKVANLTQGTAKISAGQDVTRNFLLAFLSAGATQNYFDLMAKGATFKEITLDALRRTPVLLPPVNEQIYIDQLVAKHTGLLDEICKQAIQSVSLLKERRSALISAAVTGKIDVRGWQPPASASTPELEQEAV